MMLLFVGICSCSSQPNYKNYDLNLESQNNQLIQQANQLSQQLDSCARENSRLLNAINSIQNTCSSLQNENLSQQKKNECILRHNDAKHSCELLFRDETNQVIFQNKIVNCLAEKGYPNGVDSCI